MTTLPARLVEAMANNGSIAIDTIAPFDLTKAYAAQDEVVGLLGVTPDGMKLALRDEGLLRAPLLSARRADTFPFQPGLRMEAELALVLGRDLPVRDTAYSRAEIFEAIEAVHIGVEMIRSRYEGGAQGRTTLLIADLMSNVGYRLGPKLDKGVLDRDTAADALQVTIGGSVVFDGPARHPDGDPLAALVVYANSPDRSAQGLAPGFVMTTGSLCGALPLDGPGPIDIAFQGETFRLSLTA